MQEDMQRAKRVLLVGWDGVELGTLRPLIRRGLLPYIGSLLDRGTSVELSTPRPSLAAAAWTTLATGQRPHQHGILHSRIPSRDGSRLEPITCDQRRCPAVWNVLQLAGLRAHVVGWPVTYPAEVVSGVCVSDVFAAPRAHVTQRLGKDCEIWPIEVAANLRSRRVTPAQIEQLTLTQMLPDSAKCLPKYEMISLMCRAILAETASLFRALGWCLDERPWDFAATLFPGIRRCHELAHSLGRASPAAAEFAQVLIAGCYQHHDQLLGQILSQVGEDTLVIAVSPAGDRTSIAEACDDANLFVPNVSVTRSLGLAVFKGPGIRQGAALTPRSLLDLAPTILNLLGVRNGHDLEGRPWVDLYDVVPQPATIGLRGTIASRETVAETKQFVAQVDNSVRDEVEQHGVEHLINLGYVDPHDVAARKAVTHCQRVTELNRAISMLDSGSLTEAIGCLEQLSWEQPNWYSVHFLLAETYYRSKQQSAAQGVVDRLFNQGFEKPQLYLLSAAVHMARRQWDAARVDLSCAHRAAVSLPGWHALHGEFHLRQRDFARAETAFEAAIAADGPTYQSLDGLAAVDLKFGRYEQAAIHALDALALEMRFGRAHFHLALALMQLNRPHEALQALETWATVAPQSAAPYCWMARVYDEALHDPQRAAACRSDARYVVRRRRHPLKVSTKADTSTRSSAP